MNDAPPLHLNTSLKHTSLTPDYPDQVPTNVSEIHTQESTHFKQVGLTVRVVVILKAIEGVVVSVAVDGTHSWTW